MCMTTNNHIHATGFEVANEIISDIDKVAFTIRIMTSFRIRRMMPIGYCPFAGIGGKVCINPGF